MPMQRMQCTIEYISCWKQHFMSCSFISLCAFDLDLHCRSTPRCGPWWASRDASN